MRSSPVRPPLHPCAAALRRLCALAPILLAAACGTIAEEAGRAGLPIQDWDNVRTAPEPRVETRRHQHAVAFAAGSSEVSREEGQRLRAFLAPLPADGGQATYVIAPPAALAEARIAAVGRLLTLGRRRWQPGLLGAEGEAGLGGDEVAVVVDVATVVLPPCPNWTGWSQDTFSNRPASNFGCATAINLGLQVANPEDLVQGRTPGLSDGTVLSAAIERYRQGKTKPLIRDAGSSEVYPAAGNAK